MANVEKIAQGIDVVLNCIPVVNTINSSAQALYKLAHKVDSVGPVARGLATSIKIHVLSKSNFEYFVDALPIVGNVVSLFKLVVAILCGFDDNLIFAVCQNNKEVVDLCLGNGALENPQRADVVLGQAALSSNNEIFTEILQSRQDWSTRSLMNALRCRGGSGETVANAKSILDYWDTKGLGVSEMSEGDSGIWAMEHLLEQRQAKLVDRLLVKLPNEIPFIRIKKILLDHSCVKYNTLGVVQEKVVLTPRQRSELIAKSAKPSFEEISDYFVKVELVLDGYKTESTYADIHFDTLKRLLDKAELQNDEMGEFIAHVCRFNAPHFLGDLVTTYEGQLTPQSKKNILLDLSPSLLPYSGKLSSHGWRKGLFQDWVEKWRPDISQHARQLYIDIEKFNSTAIDIRKQPSSPDCYKGSDYATVQEFERIGTLFKDILVRAFPGCDQASQEEAV